VELGAFVDFLLIYMYGMEEHKKSLSTFNNVSIYKCMPFLLLLIQMWMKLS